MFIIFNEAAICGSIDAHYFIGLYYDSLGKKNKAKKYYKVAADENLISAQTALAVIENGFDKKDSTDSDVNHNKKYKNIPSIAGSKNVPESRIGKVLDENDIKKTGNSNFIVGQVEQDDEDLKDRVFE